MKVSPLLAVNIYVYHKLLLNVAVVVVISCGSCAPDVGVLRFTSTGAVSVVLQPLSFSPRSVPSSVPRLVVLQPVRNDGRTASTDATGHVTSFGCCCCGRCGRRGIRKYLFVVFCLVLFQRLSLFRILRRTCAVAVMTLSKALASSSVAATWTPRIDVALLVRYTACLGAIH
jgi:hypothetical protein